MAKEPDYGLMAEQLFLEGSTLKEIAAILPVSVTALSGWKIQNDWDAKKKATRKRPLALADKITRLIDAELENVEVGNLSRDEADNLSKLAAVLSRLGGVDDFRSSVVIGMKEYAKFVMASDVPDEEKGLHQNMISRFFEKMKESNRRK